MFKRNPDAIALVLVCFFVVTSARATPVVSAVSRQGLKERFVASLKQCLHHRSHTRPIARSL